jgi:hypothetical protein
MQFHPLYPKRWRNQELKNAKLIMPLGSSVQTLYDHLQIADDPDFLHIVDQYESDNVESFMRIVDQVITTATSSPPRHHHVITTTTSSPPPRHRYHHVIITSSSPRYRHHHVITTTSSPLPRHHHVITTTTSSPTPHHHHHHVFITTSLLPPAVGNHQLFLEPRDWAGRRVRLFFGRGRLAHGGRMMIYWNIPTD